MAMSRTKLLVLALFLVLGTAAAVLLMRGREPRPATGPIILISIDTLRADRLPAYGYTGTRTPHIDRLVTDGILFENAYSHSPQTLPSHTSMLTGELPFEHGVRDNIGFSVKTSQRTLAGALREAGYTTGGFVSAYVLRQQVHINQGFDRYDDELPPASPDRPLGQMQRPGTNTLSAATKWLDGLSSPKFFLFFHIYEPHRPYTPPAHIKATNPYDGEVEYADEIVGKLLDYLRSKDLYDSATIVLLSDHGEGLGDHGEDEHGIFLYRETTHVPFLVKLPGSSHGARRVADPVQHVDLMPTLLELAGAGNAGSKHGRSLVPALRGTGPLPAASIYSESLSPRYHFGWSELYALSDDRYRLIRAPKDELYDLTQDPKELTSIAAEREQVRTAMRRALDGMIATSTVTAPSAVSAEDRQKLAALGYIGTQTGASLTIDSDKLPDPKDRVEVLKKYKQATDLAGSRQFAAAVAVYRDILRDEAGMTDVWLQLADIYNRMGMTAQAVDAFKEVVKRNPRDPAGLTGAAAGLLRLGRLDDAKAHAELATEVAPAISHELLARIAVQQGRADEARREARLGTEADPTLPLAPFVEGALLHAQGQYAAALPHLRQAEQALQKRTVQMPDVNFYLGDSLARLEQYAEAMPFLKAEIALFPGHVRARAAVAMLHRAMGQREQSEQDVADLLQNAPTREGYDVAAQLWAMFGEPARAAQTRAAAARLPR